MQKNRLRTLLTILSPDGTSADFAEFDSNIEKLKIALKEKVQIKTLEDVNSQLERFKKDIDLKTATDSIVTVAQAVDKKIVAITKILEQRTAADEKTETRISLSLDKLGSELASLEVKTQEIDSIRQRLYALPDSAKLSETLLTSATEIIDERLAGEAVDRERLVTNYTNEIEKVRKELTSRINNAPHGGNANRNITIGGNSSVLSKYGDINFNAGADITLTYVNNETTKQLDVTIAGTGGTSVGFQQPTGSVNGINQVFVFPVAPNAIAVDNGRVIQKVSSDTTINWTGTTTVTLLVAPTADIFGVS